MGYSNYFYVGIYVNIELKNEVVKKVKRVNSDGVKFRKNEKFDPNTGEEIKSVEYDKMYLLNLV